MSSGNGTNAFYALDEATGKIAWQFSAPQGFDGYPLLAGDTVYVGANGYTQASFYALDAQTRQSALAALRRMIRDCPARLRWQQPLRWRARLLAVPGQRGIRQIWLARQPRRSSGALPRYQQEPRPPLADGVVYVGGESGVVEALDAATGTHAGNMLSMAR